jgi:hypothetical protein
MEQLEQLIQVEAEDRQDQVETLIKEVVLE